MLKFTMCIVAGSLVALGLSAASAHAQSRVFVAAQGSDANPCTFAAPCRTFQHAHDVVAANGEIDVLDPAGYGDVIINKPVSIQGHGFAGIAVASNGTGITVGAGAADAVNINGVLIDGAGVGQGGIVFNAGASLTINGCVIRGVTGIGISIRPASGSIRFAITNTIVSNNGNDGIQYLPPSGSAIARGIIDHVTAANNGNAGIDIESNSSGATVVALSNSVASNNTSFGIFVLPALGPLTLSIDNTTVSGNGVGIEALTTSTVLLNRSVITGNATGITNSTSPNTFYTYGNNLIDLNSPNYSGTMPNTTVTLR